jgi:fucose 4-O-acetylase-like acetyltransferase
MKERLEYIDALKGFAILLVVMGHVIPWSFQSFENVSSMSPTPVLLWKIIYSFHMPLFMFVSGFLFGQSHFVSPKEYILKMWKKTKMLLVPYIVCSILIYMWRGGREWTYWYLLTLLQLLILVGSINFFIEKIKNPQNQIVAEIVALGGRIVTSTDSESL